MQGCEIDGAGPFRQFLNVTLPMLSPYILFNFIMEPQFLDTAEGMPQPAFEIFQAFDTAEYYRGSEPPEVDPVEQYTRPRIAEILVRLAAA